MKKLNRPLKLTLAAAFVLLLGAPSPSSGEDVYKKMANDFAKYSNNKNVKNLAVLGFSRKARTSREESDYVSEKLMSCLVASGKVNLLERSQLGKVLEERRLAASGVSEEAEGPARKMNPSDAIIVGTIFGTKDHLKIIAKMIDPLTGAVLHTVEAQTERQWDMVEDKQGFEFDVPDLKVIAEMFGEEDLRPEFADFRDAPASLNTDSCNVRRTRLAAMQRVALEAKAKYWSLQMRDPKFNSMKLTRNPGGEIQNAGDRKKFYAMLRSLHLSPDAPRLSVPELNAVVKLMDEEARISDECGLH
ncbi:MAG: CsgG/HfaB family protein [Elusimicrobiales bacterium]|nr:CsgG/HfaB family protein [Elusimicrobiales bacterium]